MSETYPDQMFNLGGAAVTALTQMNSGTSSGVGTYAPKADGTLIQLIIKVTPQAASSLAQGGYVQLVCTAWNPVNTLICPFNGFGLATAPQVIGGNLEDTIYPPSGSGYQLNLPVRVTLPITGSIIYFFSPVTPSAVVEGIFTA